MDRSEHMLAHPYYLYGVKDERERIIALLEADCANGIGDKIQGCFHEVTIALIKGETE